jgi:hypothetical protein
MLREEVEAPRALGFEETIRPQVACSVQMDGDFINCETLGGESTRPGRAHLCSVCFSGDQSRLQAQGPRIRIETNLKSRVHNDGGERKSPGVYFRKLGFLKVDWHGLFHSKHFGRRSIRSLTENII